MLYIFLDIDGVLNTSAEWRKLYALNDKCVERFAAYVKKQKKEVRIVLSSSWRTGFAYNRESLPHIKDLKKRLAVYGLSIYGKTPILKGHTREEEIKAYIENNNVKDYVIIDDDKSLFSSEVKNLYLVDAKKGFCI